MFERKTPTSVTVAINHGRLESWSEGKNGNILILLNPYRGGYLGKNNDKKWFEVNVSKKQLSRMNIKSSDLKDKVYCPEKFERKEIAGD